MNINRLKRCYVAPKQKRAKKASVPTIEENTADEEWDSSDEEPLHLLGKRKLLPTSQSSDNL